MAKFSFSMGNENYRKLQLEARTRDVTIQALIRTVVIPEWIKTHIETTAINTHASVTDTSSLLSHTTGFLGQAHRSLPPSAGRSRTYPNLPLFFGRLRFCPPVDTLVPISL